VQALGFDVVELSTGFISLPLRDWLNLVDDVRDAGLKVCTHTVCILDGGEGILLQPRYI
jgi:phosphosulfolactate synthase (CoM biosynthesis protein A)